MTITPSKTQPKSKSGNTRRNILIGAVSVAALYGSLMTYSYLNNSAPKNNSKGRKLHQILIDGSDPFNVVQNQVIDSMLYLRLRQRLKAGDVIEVYILTDDPLAPIKEVYSVIVPPKGYEVNAIFERPSRAEKIWREEFYNPYYYAVEEARKARKLEQTPLLQGLAELSKLIRAKSYAETELIVISDCLHHVTNQQTSYHHLGATIYDEGLVLMNEAAADFSGATVNILYLLRPRQEKSQTPEHRQWLTEWLRRAMVGEVLLEVS